MVSKLRDHTGRQCIFIEEVYRFIIFISMLKYICTCRQACWHPISCNSCVFLKIVKKCKILKYYSIPDML